MDNEAIRRDILRLLYVLYNEDPEDMIEYQRLAKRLQLSDTQIASNLEYLIGKGYVKPTPVPRGNRVFRFAQITVDGIDLVEHPEKFEATFPKQEVHHHYHGDYFNVKVGDNNTNVAIGKGVYQFNTGAIHPLGEVVNRLVEQATVRGNLPKPTAANIAQQLGQMLNVLREPDPDLGALQRMRRDLVEQGGWVEAIALAFFRQPEVVNLIQLTVSNLIGEDSRDTPSN